MAYFSQFLQILEFFVGKVFEDAFGTGQKSGDGRPTSVNLLQKGVPEYTDKQPIDEDQLLGDENCVDA